MDNLFLIFYFFHFFARKPKNDFVERKNKFLNRVSGANHQDQNKYKRAALSPIRYASGKSLAVGHVVELFPDNIKKLVSLFFGGGSVEIAASKELGLEVIDWNFLIRIGRITQINFVSAIILCDKTADFYRGFYFFNIHFVGIDNRWT